MTQQEIDEKPPLNRFHKWIGEPAGITKGWLLLSIALGWVFLGCALYAAVRTTQLDNRVTENRIQSAIDQQVNTCVQTNVTRAASKVVALADVAEDRRIWVSIDTFFEGGIPEPTRTVVFDGLAARERRINESWLERDCSTITLEIQNAESN